MARYRSLFLFLACALVAAVHSEQGKRDHHASASASALMSSPLDNEPELLPIESAIKPNRRKNNFRPVLFKNRHLEESAAIEVEYEQIYQTLIFLAAVFVMGKLAAMIGMPSLVGEIFCGFLLGPPLADIVPFSQAIVLVGEIGLIMLLLEAGIDIDIAQLKETGGRALAIACTGSVLPLVTGIGLSMASGTNLRTGIAVGACFSPTSLGVASNALQAGGISNTPIGQLIVAACVLDDIIALIILSIIEVLTNEEAELWEYFIPVISAFGFLILLGWCALTWIPKVIEFKILPLFPEDKRDLAAFGLMLALLMAYLPLLFYTKASYLTGAFLAGLSFSQIHSVHKSFVHNTHNLMKWLLRIFFAATIGFQVPIKQFWSPHVIAWGFIFYVCVLMKLPLGLFSPSFQPGSANADMPFNTKIKDSLILGIAMTCRGEFSFIIAAFSLGNDVFDDDTYSAVIWAVLISCITSPFALLYVIKYYNAKSMDVVKGIGKLPDGKVPLHLVIQCRTDLKWGLQISLTKCAVESGLAVVDQRSWHPRGLDAIVVSELYVSDTTTMISFPPKSINSEEGIAEAKMVTARCEEIRSLMISNIAQISAKVNVVEWMPYTLKNNPTEHDVVDLADKVFEEARRKLNIDEEIDTLLPEIPIMAKKTKTLSGPLDDKMTAPHKVDEESPMPAIGEDESRHGEEDEVRPTAAVLRRRRVARNKTLSVPAFGGRGLWDDDTETQEIAMKSAYVPTVTYDITSPSYGASQRRRQVSDLSMILDRGMLPTVEEHLQGYVRYNIDEEQKEK